MPVEFMQYPPQENTGVSGDTLYKMAMAYDGSGRRISKTRWVKAQGDEGWSRKHVTHYTGIGTEVRENFAGSAKETKVVVNMPQGLGRYGIENADHVAENGSAQTFEWFLKNHLGSTMLVYGTGGTSGGLKAAYDYRSFGEQIELTSPSTGKVTENFTGKEKDDETQLDYFGARYLDPMLGLWISVDPARQFASPYLYAGNGVNPIIGVDDDGRYFIHENSWGTYEIKTFSKGEAISGWLARDGTEIVLALIPFPFISSLYGEAKGYITQGKAGVAIATGENASVLALSLENKAAARYSSFLFALFDAKLGWDELMSKVDSPEFIDEFNKRMKSNGGEDYNSFKTKEEADAYAQEISKSIKENNQPSAEE